MAISPARVAAYQILMRVETQGAYASELLHSEQISKLSALDRNLAMQIVMGVLRWQSKLDAALSPFVTGKNEVSRLDAEVRTALRMAAFQFRYLDRIPVSAAVNDSVELVKRAKKRSAAPFVNAVLRKVAGADPLPEREPRSGKELAEAFAHPTWLVERWERAYGFENASRICEADQNQPATALRLPMDSAAAAAIDAELQDAGVVLAPGAFVASARRVISGDVTATAAFRERRIAIQDEASQLVAALVGRGERILDCCAAPGGKTSAMAARNPQAKITATELHPQRARLMRELVTANNVEVVAADVTAMEPATKFDRVLADVPCSGTGTLARNPDIKWRLKPEDLHDLHQRQVAILNAALERAGTGTSDGGMSGGARIVYSTCSLEAEENEQVVDEVLRERKDFRIADVKELLLELQRSAELAWDDIDSLVSGKFLRTLPGVHPCDGFFAAVIEKINP